MKHPLLLSMALIASLSGCSDRSSLPLDVATKIQKLDLSVSYDAKRYEFLKSPLGGRSLVAVAESVELTQELPHAQLAFVKYLHQELGFDVIAFQGALVDAWIASDYSYAFNDPLETKTQHAQQLAWFNPWQTAAMRDVMAYVVSTQGTSHPLYLAGFGIQPGSSRSLSTESALFTSLAGALRAYVAAPDPGLEDEMKLALARLADCDSSGFPASDAERDAALATVNHIQSWTTIVLPALQAQHRPANHAAALSLLPSALRKRVMHCDANRHAADDTKASAATPDRLEGQNILDLLSVVSAAKKVILWADHGHLHYNSSGENPRSAGEYLHQQIPDRLFTIGFFAGGGRHNSLINRGPLIVADRSLASARSLGAESALAGLHLPQVFVDLSKLDPRDIKLSEWFAVSTSRLEDGEQQTALAHDFDGAVYVQDVRSEWPSFLPEASKKRAAIAGFILDRGMLLGALILFCGVAFLGVRAMRKRRKPPAKSPPRQPPAIAPPASVAPPAAAPAPALPRTGEDGSDPEV